MTRDRHAERLTHYMRHRNRVGEKMLRAVLRAQATVEAAQTTNDVLERMGLLDLQINPIDVLDSAQTTLRAEIVAILAQHAHLPISAKRALCDRVVARMAPLKDNVGLEPRTPPSTIARHESLARAMQREAENVLKDK